MPRMRGCGAGLALLACQLSFASAAAADDALTAEARRNLLARIAEKERQIAVAQKELQQFKAQAGIASEPKRKSSTKAPPPTAAGSLIEQAQAAYLREYKFPPRKKTEEPVANPCEPQRLYVRSDLLDNLLYGAEAADKAKGASVSYSNDQLTGKQAVSINGAVTYMLLRNLCPDTPPGGVPFLSGYSISPFVVAKGDLTQPQSPKETSALKFGVDAQVELSRLIFLRQVFGLRPYYQTDYRGLAEVTGLTGYWEPYDLRFNLGGYLDTPGHAKYLGWYWQVRADADVREVTNPGLTSLTAGGYAWVGVKGRAFFFLFPHADEIPEIFRNRFSLIGTAEYYHDLRSGMDINKYSAELQYKLNAEGTASLGLSYERGTDKDTLVASDIYKVKLNYAY